MGLSCGTGCSPVINLFLTTYVVRCKGDTKRSLLSFAQFFGGKASAVVVVCLAAALTGNVILDAGGYLGKYSLGFLMPAFLLVTGLYMLREMIHSRNGCEGCCGHGCGSKAKGTLADSAPAVGGFLYALTMNFGQAMILAVLFSLASALSPLLFMVLFMKLVVTKMQDDVPKLVEILRWILSILVLILGAYLLVRYLVGSPVAIAA
jgi:hypothetical protein